MWTFLDDDKCETCPQILEELETIDDDTDKHGIQFVKSNDVKLAHEIGIFAFPALVYYETGVPIMYDGELGNMLLLPLMERNSQTIYKYLITFFWFFLQVISKMKIVCCSGWSIKRVSVLCSKVLFPNFSWEYTYSYIPSPLNSRHTHHITLRPSQYIHLLCLMITLIHVVNYTNI